LSSQVINSYRFASAEINVCSTETVNDYHAMPEGGSMNYGIKVSGSYGMIGETVASVTFYLAKYNCAYTMSGTLSAYVGVSGNYTLIGTANSATVLTSCPQPDFSGFDAIKFTGSGTRLLSSGDYIWVSHPSGGAGNLCAIPTNTSGAQSGTNGMWRGGDYPPTGTQFSTTSIKQCVSNVA